MYRVSLLGYTCTPYTGVPLCSGPFIKDPCVGEPVYTACPIQAGLGAPPTRSKGWRRAARLPRRVFVCRHQGLLPFNDLSRISARNMLANHQHMLRQVLKSIGNIYTNMLGTNTKTNTWTHFCKTSKDTPLSADTSDQTR